MRLKVLAIGGQQIDGHRGVAVTGKGHLMTGLPGDGAIDSDFNFIAGLDKRTVRLLHVHAGFEFCVSGIGSGNRVSVLVGFHGDSLPDAVVRPDFGNCHQFNRRGDCKLRLRQCG